MSYTDNYLVLRDYLEKHASAEHWAKSRAAQQDEGKDVDPLLEKVEAARAALLIYIRDQYVAGQEEEWLSDEQALDALMTCVVIDRANALYLMKINRDEPDCPRGFPWVCNEDLKKVAHVNFKGKAMTRSSITRKYRMFAEAHRASGGYMEGLNAMLQLTLPEWAH